MGRGCRQPIVTFTSKKSKFVGKSYHSVSNFRVHSTLSLVSAHGPKLVLGFNKRTVTTNLAVGSISCGGFDRTFSSMIQRSMRRRTLGKIMLSSNRLAPRRFALNATRVVQTNKP